MMDNSLLQRFRENWFRIGVHAGALAPLGLLILDALQDNLTANPIQAITHRTGKAALVLLVLSLVATPANTLFGFRPALKVRRALGLYAFLYVSLHFLTFIGLDYGFDPQLILEAIFEKRFALAGFAAGLLLLPLAITSTRGWKKRLGRNWKRLHQLVYVAALLAVIHYVWLVKADYRQPLFFGVVVVLLLVMRIPAVRSWAANLRLRELSSRFASWWQRSTTLHGTLTRYWKRFQKVIDNPK